MRKILLSMLAAVAMLPASVMAQDYCTIDPSVTPQGPTPHGYTEFIISDNNGNSQTVEGIGSGTTRPMYADRTETKFVTTAGATLSFTGTIASGESTSWMMSYLYIDFGKDGVFDVDPENEGVNGDLIAHTGYNYTKKHSQNNDTADPTTKSDGTSFNSGNFFDIPTYTLPADMAPGEYRIRYKIDWNSTDPCGRDENHLHGIQGANFIYNNNGSIIDFTLVIEAPDVALTIVQPEGGEITATVDGTPVASGSMIRPGASVILGNAAAEGYTFSTYTLNDAPISGSEFTMPEEAATVSAVFEAIPAPEITYCQPDQTTSGTNHAIKEFIISDSNGNTQSVAGTGETTSRPLYADHTDVKFTTSPGATLSFSGTKASGASTEWMHSYVYIDFGSDGVFDVDPASDGINGDLIAHTGYSTARKPDGSDTADHTTRSDGSAVNHGNFFLIPDYTLPADMAPGEYRMRYKIDWNSTDPCGRTDADHLYGYQKGNFIQNVNGTIIDFTLVIEADGVALTIDQPEGGEITATVDGAAVTSGSKVTPGASVMLSNAAAQGYAFKTYTLNDAPISGNTFTMPEEAATVSAIFEAASAGDIDNPSLTLAPVSTPAVSGQNLLYVPATVLPGVSSQADLSSRSVAFGCWIRPTEFKYNNDFVMKYGGVNHTNTNCLVALTPSSSGLLTLRGFGIANADRLGLGEPLDVDATLELNKWQHVMVAVDFTAKQLRVYLNGDNVKTYDFPGDGFNNFGDSPYGFGFGGSTIGGAIDDVHIIDGVLTDTDAKLLYTEQARKVNGLAGWYKLDEVVEGTTGQFANSGSTTAVNAVYQNLTGGEAWQGAGFIGDAARTEKTPDLTSITTELMRQPVAATNTFAVPAASDYENIESLVFSAAGNTLAAGTTVTLPFGTPVAFNVTPADGYVLTSVEVAGKIVENEFVLDRDLTKDDIKINLGAGAFALTVENPAELTYSITNALNQEVTDLTFIPEGTELNLQVTVPFEVRLNAVRLGETELEATNGVYKFNMPGQATTLTIDAVTKEKYAVNFTVPENGTLTVKVDDAEITSGTEVIYGKTVVVEATANEGYEIKSLTYNGNAIDGTSFIMPQEEVTVAVELAQFGRAANPAITFKHITEITGTTVEDRVEVPMTVLGVTAESNPSDLCNQSVTYGAWVRMTERVPNDGNVIVTYGGLAHHTENSYCSITTNADGNLMLRGFGIKSHLGLVRDQTLDQVLPLNEWHYVAVAIDFEASQIRVFYDNSQVKEINLNGKTFQKVDDNPLGFGFGSVMFNGAMDDIHVFDRALYLEDITNIYYENAGAVNGLVAWYNFDETVEGTTGQFKNLAPDHNENATYMTLTGQKDGNTLIYVQQRRTEGTADLSTINNITERIPNSTDLEEERTITVRSANETLGTVAITNPETTELTITTKQLNVTVAATPAENVSFLNWTNEAGEEMSARQNYTYSGTEDITLTANFGFVISMTASNNGSVDLYADGEPIAAGTVVPAGSTVKVVATPASGYAVSRFTVNGQAMTMTANEYTFEPEANTAIEVEFAEASYLLVVNVTGQGEVLVATSGSNTKAPAESDKLTAGGPMPNNANIRVFVKPADGYRLGTITYNPGTGTEETTEWKSTASKCTWDESYFYLRNFTRHQGAGDYIINVDFTDSSAIDSIFADDVEGEVEYFNLQGMRIDAENLTPGFYIVRKGNKTAKVYINE